MGEEMLVLENKGDESFLGLMYIKGKDTYELTMPSSTSCKVID